MSLQSGFEQLAAFDAIADCDVHPDPLYLRSVKEETVRAAKEAAECVDQGAILVTSPEPNPETGKYILYGVAFYLLQDGPDEEYIYDYTVTRWNEAFFEKYYGDDRFHGAVELPPKAAA